MFWCCDDLQGYISQTYKARMSTPGGRTMKTCSKCSEEKPYDSFSPDRRRKDGRTSNCKDCRRAAYAANPEPIRARSRQYYADNLEQGRAYRRAYQQANRDAARARLAKWIAENPERYRAGRRAYYEATRARDNASSAAWRAANPEAMRAHGSRRRARQREATVEAFTFEDLLASWDERGLSGCTYCPDGAFEHIDHVIPLIRGGAHAISNLVPSCATCNRSKGSKLLDEWRPERQALLAD